jgi:hypothetical protein
MRQCRQKCQDKEFVFYYDVRRRVAHVHDRNMYGYCPQCRCFMRARPGSSCKCCGQPFSFKHFKSIKEKVRAYARDYYRKNRDRVRKYQLDYYHKPDVKEKKARWYQDNRERLRAKMLAYYYRRKKEQSSTTN